MIAKTQFAITGEDTRYFLNGALFVLGAGQLDARRDRRPPPGARRTSKRDRRQVAAEEIGVILPRKTLLGARPAAAEGEGDIQYERGENHLFFEVGGRVLISRMIDGAVSGLRARHPEEQRQARRVRARSADERASSAWRCSRTSARAR